MRRIALFICSILCLIACHDDDNDTPEQKSGRSVLVYMAGENNLTASQGVRYLRNDLNEIIEGSKQLSSNQRLFVFVDSLNSTDKDGTPVLLEVHGGEAVVIQRFDNDFYSCDPAYFRQIVQWVQTNAPAKDYGLYFLYLPPRR